MVTSDTPVLLANCEYVLITDIRIGDRVKTSDGYVSQVEVIFVRDVSDILVIKVEGNFILRCIPEQVLHFGDIKKPANLCEKGDIIGLRVSSSLDVISGHKVNKVSSSKYIGKVYTLRITEDQSFIANSFLLKGA